MPIDQFSRETFEKALPRDKRTGDALWYGLGVVAGEYCYAIPIKPNVLVYVRSSVDAGGWAASAAQDSIRCWLAEDETGKPLGSKDQRWIARTNGWAARLTETLRKLWRLGRHLGPCKHCQGGHLLALKVKAKNSSHLGRWFTKCAQCGEFVEWLTEPNAPKPEQIPLTAVSP